MTVTRKISFALDAFSQMVFRFDDPRAREAVLGALHGRGKPAGVRSCEADVGTLTVWLDANITPPALIRHLVEIETRRYAAAPRCRVRDLDDASLASLVAEATGDPELDENRVLEHLVPEIADR
jgi:hypothetical protein